MGAKPLPGVRSQMRLLLCFHGDPHVKGAHGGSQGEGDSRSQAPEGLEGLSGRSVFLCFTCDPYQPLDEITGITRRIIELCHEHNVGTTILTKGGMRSTRDFDLLRARPELSCYGATLTFLSRTDSIAWEPGAALPGERMRALRKAHDLGISTWASIEPVIDPRQALEIIKRTHEYVDVVKIGRWNYDRRANEIDWMSFALSAVALLKSLHKKYVIKKDLAAFLPPARGRNSRS